MFNSITNRSVTKNRINKMCKYFRNKNITISYEYNNSLGWHQKRDLSGDYDSFFIQEQDLWGTKQYNIKFFKKGDCIFEVDFTNNAYFTGLGQISECNSGPYCYFNISTKKNIKQFFKEIIKLFF